MRNLLVLLIRYNYVLYFILLEALCIFLLVQNNNFHRSSFINSSKYLIGGLYDQVSTIEDYFELKQTNEDLALKNEQLLNKPPKLVVHHNDDSLLNINNDTINQYQFVAAKVVNNSVNRRMNYITINKGTKHGIKKEMGVIDNFGIVGVVNHVSDNYSTIRSILHTESMISAGLKNSAYFGSLIWERKNPIKVRLKDIPKHANISIGDSVVTTSYSAIFPEGLPIGTVTEIIDRKELSFKELDVNLSNDMSNLVYVYVIQNSLKTEQQVLEQLNDN